MVSDLPPLPAGYVARPHEHEDAVLVLAVVAGCEAAELGEAQVELEDIRSDWRRPGAEPARDGILVLDADGVPAASAEVFGRRAEGNVLPAHRSRGIGSFLAAWIERRAREVGTPFVRQVVPATSRDRIQLLARAGYERCDTAWELAIDMQVAPQPAAAGSALVELRDFRPGADDEVAWRIVEAAFGRWPNRQPSPLEGWRALTVRRVGFEPWMLPIAWRDGEAVGIAYCIDHPGDDSLWVQQLAVHPARQGDGIGTRLLHECFARARARGRVRVGLSTDSRTGALDLYLRNGMVVVREFTGHRLRLSAD